MKFAHNKLADTKNIYRDISYQYLLISFGISHCIIWFEFCFFFIYDCFFFNLKTESDI